MNKYACRFRKDDAIDISYAMLDHAAWRGMRGHGPNLLMTLLGIASKAKNGEVKLSCREAAAMCGITKNTASDAFRELERRGFIVRIQDSTWRLTMLPANGKPATCNYRRWDGGVSKNRALRLPEQNAPFTGARRPKIAPFFDTARQIIAPVSGAHIDSLLHDGGVPHKKGSKSLRGRGAS